MRHVDRKFLHRVVEILEWVIRLEEGEFIESRNYTRTYMGFEDTITQGDSDDICDAVNKVLEVYGTDRRIANSMGELIPAHVRR